MKLVYPEIDHVFDTSIEYVPTLVIENQNLLYRFLEDIRGQMEGNDGQCVVSDGGSVLSVEKYVELLTDFIPFSINRKPLMSKASATLEREILEGELYGEAMELLHELESFLLKAALPLNGDILFPNINASALIKASGLEFREEYDSLPEKLVDYMELVCEFERKKLFVFYNLRSIISDHDAELFFDTVLRHGYHILMIESSEHKRLANEHRYIVDASLCEIC